MAAPLLSVQNLSVAFGPVDAPLHAVKDLSFAMQAGETLALVGESGSGKSVTALAIMRLIAREGGRASGAVLLNRSDDEWQDLQRVSEATMRNIRGNIVSMIFQEPMTSLNPVMSVGRQIAETLILHQKLREREALEEARRLIEKVMIPDAARRVGQYPHELSGGMRQRIMIAMALACRPKLLIADEPTTALDVTVQAEVIALMRRLQDEMGMGLLFITHDMGVVAQIADRVVVMRHGEKIEDNAVRPLFAAPKAAYTKQLLAAVPRLGSNAIATRAGTTPVLAVDNLIKRFPIRSGLFGRPKTFVNAVDDVSFHLNHGETLGLVGESGCGKSTTGRAIMRLIEPDAGQIVLDGDDMRSLDRRALRAKRRDIQMIFQDPYASLNPRLSVFQSIIEPLRIHRPDLNRADQRDIAAGLLKRVGLEEDHLDRYPQQFSGGQRQRLAIARALSVKPKVIVADEPVSALDVSIRAQVIELMQELQADMGLSYLFISHDMAVVEQMSHRVAVMHQGRIVETGTAADVLKAPRHPYTQRLLAAVPVPDPAERRLFAAAHVAGHPAPSKALAPVAASHVMRDGDRAKESAV